MSTYWSNDNGAVICDRHMGAYLRASVEKYPKALVHHTVLGSWEYVPAREAFSLAQDFGYICETCHFGGES